MRSFCIGIGGIDLEFWSRDTDFLSAQQLRFREYASSGLPAAVIEIVTDPPNNRPPTGPNSTTRDDEGRNLSTYENVVAYHFNSLSGKGEMCIRPQDRAFNVGLRMAVSRLLYRSGGCLVHGAAIESGGEGYLFFGPSGAGKTTISIISDRMGKRVLNDEISAIRKIDGEYWLYGTPFWGDFKGSAAPDGIRLRSLVKPIQAVRPRCSALSRTDCIIGLMQTVLNLAPAPGDTAMILDRVDDAAGIVGGLCLEFARETDFWEVLSAWGK